MLTSTNIKADTSMIDPQISKATQLVVITEEGLQYGGKPLKVGQLVELTNGEAGKYILRGWAKQAKVTRAQFDEFLLERSAGITTIAEEPAEEPESDSDPGKNSEDSDEQTELNLEPKPNSEPEPPTQSRKTVKPVKR